MSGSSEPKGRGAARGASAAVAEAFRQGPPSVAANPAIAEAFGRQAPGTVAPEEELSALAEEYEGLRVSRMGDSAAVAREAASAFRQRVIDPRTGRLQDVYALRELREAVERLRAQLPLSGGARVAEGAGRGGRRVFVEEVVRSGRAGGAR